jgi:flagellar biosynthetic protein FliR
MTFSVEKFEFFLMIMIRVTAFMFTAPFFNIKEAPVRVKIGMGAIISYLIFYILPYEQLSYTGTLGFAVSAVKEAAAGLILGFFANICTYILAFSGQLLDMEMGFSMATEFDPQTRLSISVSGNIYSYAVMLILLVTRMHYYILNALVDSFSVIPLGKVNIKCEHLYGNG